MLLTETHLHTKDVSMCANVSASEIPAIFKDAGYSNIIVTDHYNKWTLEQFGEGKDIQLDRWLGGYRTVFNEGQKLGLRVFLGMELCLNDTPEDYLMYGISEEFLKEHFNIYEYPISKVFEVANENNILLYQAHPFRPYLQRQNPKYLHGVEIFNGNMRHENNNDKALVYAIKNSLLQLSGSDYHNKEDIGLGGIYLPENITNNEELVDYLKNNEVEMYIKQ